MGLASISQKLFLIILIITSISCSNEDMSQKQIKLFLTSLQNLDIDQCVEMTYLYQVKMIAIQNEPQFKKDKMIDKIRNDIRTSILNQYENDSIVYVFRFPCQWQILETKIISQESANGPFSNISSFYRVFVAVRYNSIENSPESVPLINKDDKSVYKIKEIILHCDFDPETELYMEWGLDKHIPW